MEYIPFQENHKLIKVPDESKPIIQEQLFLGSKVQDNKLMNLDMVSDGQSGQPVSSVKSLTITENKELEPDFLTWFNTNIERVKDFNTRLGSKSSSPNHSLFGNYLDYCKNYNLDPYKFTEFVKNLLKILKVYKDLKHKKIKDGTSYFITNLKLK